MSIVTTVLGLNIFLYCDTYPVPGVNSKFSDSNSTSIALNSGCNSGCSCKENLFVPVCIEGLTYVNPCNAGCKKIASATVFSNCSCTPSSKRRISTGTVGLCKTSCGVLPIMYFVLSWFVGFAIMCNATPCTMATLRCVPHNLRSFALGLQWMLVRVLGAIPGPILFGYIIDQSCVFWSKKCSNTQGTCTIYDNKKMAIGIGALILGLNISIVLLISLAYIAEKWRLAKEGGNVLEKETVMEIENKGCKENSKDIDTKL